MTASCSESVVKTNKLGNTKCHTHALQKNMLHSCSVHTRFQSPQPCVLKVRTRHFIRGGQILSVLWQHLKELLCGCSSKTANICETVSVLYSDQDHDERTTRSEYTLCVFQCLLASVALGNQKIRKDAKMQPRSSIVGRGTPMSEQLNWFNIGNKRKWTMLDMERAEKSHITPEKSQM